MRFKGKYECLTKKDMIDLLEIMDDFSDCISNVQLTESVRKLKSIICFDVALCTYFDKRDWNSEVIAIPESLNVTNWGYPEELMEKYWKEKLYKIDIPVQAYFQTLEPQNFSEAIIKYNDGVLNETELKMREFGLSDGWIYGIENIFGFCSSTFSISGGAIKNDKRTKRIVEFITPFILEAHKTILKMTKKKDFDLTKRELEVLNWIKEGKTSWEISVILKISKRTIDYHTNNCICKLNAANRSNAVAIAIFNDLIQL